MSKRNGDRSRAHREQQKKLLRRKNTQAIRLAEAAKRAAPVKQKDGPVPIGGMVKSPQTVAYEILAEARCLSKDVDDANEVILRVHPDVAKALRSSERDVLQEIETYLGGVVSIKSDPAVHQEQFDIALS